MKRTILTTHKNIMILKKPHEDDYQERVKAGEISNDTKFVLRKSYMPLC